MFWKTAISWKPRWMLPQLQICSYALTTDRVTTWSRHWLERISGAYWKWCDSTPELVGSAVDKQVKGAMSVHVSAKTARLSEKWFYSHLHVSINRGVHSIVRRLRTNPPRKINLRFFFSFCFLPPRLVFLQMNRKRMSLTGVLLQHSNWNCDLEVAGELQRRWTGWAGSGSGSISRSRSPKGVNVMHKA